MHRGDTYKKRISSVRQPGILFPRKQDIQLSRFPDIPCFYPAFASLLAIWLNNEPVQAIDVIVYGMQAGHETFSVYPCCESCDARNPVCDATH